jgi:hypothetical protein
LTGPSSWPGSLNLDDPYAGSGHALHVTSRRCCQVQVLCTRRCRMMRGIRHWIFDFFFQRSCVVTVAILLGLDERARRGHPVVVEIDQGLPCSILVDFGLGNFDRRQTETIAGKSEALI